jgi:hypothetical protein
MSQANRTWLVIVAVFISIRGLGASEPNRAESHIRFNSSRISELFRHGMRHSPSFRDLVATLEVLDSIVYVEEGSCRQGTMTPCLQAMPPTAGAKRLLVKFDPRQPLRRAVSQLAHELYHAAEVGREADVTDQASLRRLYARIGFRSCLDSDDCWETRAAIAFEALIMEDLGGNGPPE